MNPPDEKMENVAPDEKIENVELTEQIEKSEFSERIENMALTERRARKPFTQSTEKVPKPEHLRPARTCACEPYQKAYVRTCAHVTEAHPFVHSAPCAAAPVRTPPVARDRWRDVGRGRHQEMCRWAQSSFAAHESPRWAGQATTALQGEAADLSALAKHATGGRQKISRG